MHQVEQAMNPIRPATHDDQGAIQSLVFDILRSYGLSPDPQTTDADLFDLKQHYFDRGGHFAVLTDADRIIGTVGLFNLGKGTVELRKMYLAAEYRGRGLGKRLLEHALSTARALGFRRVTLETASVLQEAISLYEKSGFKPFTPDHLSSRCNQAYCMEL
jgi:putative acetyltransferase